jgi:outer membrane receptor for ferric coprogen and ferric-rhodotorulic acid
LRNEKSLQRPTNDGFGEAGCPRSSSTSRDLWQVALSVNNVLDKRYYLSQDNVNLWHGDPRNFVLRIDAKY